MKNETRVLITSPNAPIYHNQAPSGDAEIGVQNRWKGKCIRDFYDTRETPSLNGESRKELVRLVLVWDDLNQTPSIFVDGVWTNYGYNKDALIIQGTSEETLNSFKGWYSRNPNSNIESKILDLSIKTEINTNENKSAARDEMNQIFNSYLSEIDS
jgi:hypothetical protein